MKRGLLAVGIGLVLMGAAGVVYALLHREEGVETRSSLIDTTLLNRLPQLDASGVYTDRLAPGLLPPTNKWFTGVALQEVPQTVFPTPYAFTPTDTGFSYGLPDVEVSEDVVMAAGREDVVFEIEDADHYRITRYDDMSVELTYQRQDDTPLARVTIVAGVPFIYVSGIDDTPARLISQSEYTGSEASRVTEVGEKFYAVAGAEDVQDSMQGKEMALYASENKADIDTMTTYADRPIKGAKVTYRQKEAQYETTITFDAPGDVLFGFLSHQTGVGDVVASSATIYGTQDFRPGTSFTFQTATIDAAPELNLEAIGEQERSDLVTMLRREINATDYAGVDTYFAGKELYRSAQLLQLARQLEQPGIAQTIHQKLLGELRLWFAVDAGREEKSFYFDTKLKTIVGRQAAFGSDEANDHHFHYGYFIYAASVLAQGNEAVADELSPMIDLLIADIANYMPNELITTSRVFDPYFGHSWASGPAPFNDGNNQESSSEAINAWVATSLWASVRGNEALRQQSQWMLSQEVNAMRAYWLGNDGWPEQGYGHEIFSLNWGGKRDNATFFSVEPAAKLGILLIPLNPTMVDELVFNRELIAPQLAEVGGDTLREVYNFQDYLLMYKALSGAVSLGDVAAFDERWIDGANSRSYMYAWVASVR